MKEDISKLFLEDTREKKLVAQGARYRASRTGKIGTMKMPSDFAGKEYKKSSPLVTYKIEDIINTINKAPLLKKIIFERMDADYKHFRESLDEILDSVFETNQELITIMLNEVTELKKDLDIIKEHLHEHSIALQEKDKQQQSYYKEEKIEELKVRVFKRLNEAEDAGIKLTSNNVLKRHPVINYYLYQQKIWPGYRKMLEDYHENFKA